MSRLSLTLTVTLAATALACGSNDTNLIGQGGSTQGGADAGGASTGGAGGSSSGTPSGQGGSGTGTATGTPTGTATGTPTGSTLPCAPTATWEATWETKEDALVALINGRRQAGGSCGAAGTFPPMNAVTTQPALRDVARAHVEDMVVQDYFGHIAPNDGSWLGAAMACAPGTPASASIASGNPTAQEVFDQLIEADGTCANLHASGDAIGVGYYYDENSQWGSYWAVYIGGN